MATEYKLSYTASEIDENLKKIDELQIKKGSGEDSIVIGDGNAEGDNSVAGGSNDIDEIDKIKKMAQLAGYTVDTDNPTAYGDGSLALGVGAKAHSMGSLAIGISNSAGVKGFYWHSIDWSGEKPVIQLSTEQKPYYYYEIPIIGTVHVNETASWNKDAANLLANWAVGDSLTIVNNVKYGEKAVITAIDSTNGKVTIQSLPFTSNDVKVEYASLADIKELVWAFDDYSIYNPSKVSSGVVEFAYGALSLGLMTNASGSFSSALGYGSKVTTDFGHAEGFQTVANYAAHAEGYMNEARGRSSHAEGGETIASGNRSHAEGSATQATNTAAHAEGSNTKATNTAAHAEGNTTKATGEHSHAEGQLTEATGKNSHSEGYKSQATNNTAHAEGYGTLSNGISSHSEGYETVASETGSHAEGRNTIAASKYQHVEGKYNIVDTETKYAHIIGGGSKEDVVDENGNITTQNRKNIHTVDWKGNAWYSGDVYVDGNSKEEGKKLITADEVPDLISSSISITNGVGEDSIQQVSSTPTFNTTDSIINNLGNIKKDGDIIKHGAFGIASSAFGVSQATGTCSHSEGYKTIAYANYTHTEGYNTIASSKYQHVEGKYNIPDTKNKYAHIIGGGDIYEEVGTGGDTDITWIESRMNIHTVDWQGNGRYLGDVYVGSASEGIKLAKVSEVGTIVGYNKNTYSELAKAFSRNKSIILDVENHDDGLEAGLYDTNGNLLKTWDELLNTQVNTYTFERTKYDDLDDSYKIKQTIPVPSIIVENGVLTTPLYTYCEGIEDFPDTNASGELFENNILVVDTSVHTIGEKAFKNSFLAGVILPNSVTTIKNNIIEHTYMKEFNTGYYFDQPYVVIPDSVIDIDKNALYIIRFERGDDVNYTTIYYSGKAEDTDNNKWGGSELYRFGREEDFIEEYGSDILIKSYSEAPFFAKCSYHTLVPLSSTSDNTFKFKTVTENAIITYECSLEGWSTNEINLNDMIKAYVDERIAEFFSNN